MAKDILILGGGIAGLEVALKIERKISSKHNISIVEPREALLFYPASHKIMNGYPEETITINYSEKLDSRNINHIKDKATEINLEKQEIKMENSGVADFDYLVIALGAEANYHGLEEKNADTLRYKEDLIKIRTMIQQDNIENLSIVGGGATGIEAAAALKEAKKRDENKDFKIRLFHSKDRLLPKHSQKLAKKAQEILEKAGIEIRLNQRIKGIEPHCVCTEDGEEFATDEVIWAGGIQKHQLIKKSQEISQDRKGVKVNQKHQVQGYQNVYAVGDCASYPGSKARALYALFEAKTAAKNIKRQVQGSRSNLSDRSIPYDPLIIYLGRNCSALEFGSFVFTGFIPSLMERIGVEKRYMWIRKKLL